MIVVGTKTFEGTVVKDPYGMGLRWDELQRQRRDSGWNVSLQSRFARRGSNNIAVAVRDRNGRPLHGSNVILRLERPASSDTVEAPAREHHDGVFYALIDIPVPGSWTAIIAVTAGGRTIEFEETLYVE